MTNTGAETYFLLLQTLASGLLALPGVLTGLSLAWMIWGRRGRKVRRARIDVVQLREEWEKIRPETAEGAASQKP